MNRTRLALYTIVLAAAWFLLGRYWPGEAPAPQSPKSTAPVEDKAKHWPATAAGLEALFLARPRSDQDKALIALLEAGRKTAGSAAYDFHVYDRYASIWRTYRKSKEDPVVLEIGPGYNLGQGLLFVLTGARKYTGLDLFESTTAHDLNNYAAAHALLNLVAPGSIRLQPEQAYAVKGDKVEFNPERIEYVYPRESWDLRMPDASVDFVFSNSVFEHVTDPERTAQAIGKVLRRGGISAHHVDFRDHVDFSKPLDSLKFEESAWRARFTPKTISNYTNRRRLPDIVKAFERSGLRILRTDVTKIPVTEEMRSAMHADFQKYSLEDLGVTGALIVAEKP